MGISKEPRVMIWGVSGGVGMRGCLEQGTCPYWETGLDVKIGHSIATVDRWCSQQGTPPGGLVRVRNVGTGRAGTFPLVLRRRSGARIGYRRDGPMGGCWVGVGPSGGTSCTDGEPGRWDRVDVQVDRLQHLVEKGIVRPGTSRRAGSSAFLSLCGGETIGSRPHQARPHRQRRRRRRPPEVSVKIFATSRRTTTLVPGDAAPSQRGDRDDSMGFRRLVNG